MFDPLGSSPFAEDNLITPPWPTTPHPPNSPIPNLKRSPNSQPQTPDKVPTSPSGSVGQFGKEPQIYGQPDTGLISPVANVGSNGTKFEKQEPYLRARITMLDRNRRDILVRFDAQVNHIANNIMDSTNGYYRQIYQTSQDQHIVIFHGHMPNFSNTTTRSSTTIHRLLSPHCHWHRHLLQQMKKMTVS